MSMREYLLVLLMGTCLAIMGWCVILVSINPFTAGVFGFVAFYTTSFCALMGITATAGTALRARRVDPSDDMMLMRVLVRSLRQGAFLALIVCAGLGALSLRLFSLVPFLFALAGVGVVEFLLLMWEERHVARMFKRG